MDESAHPVENEDTIGFLGRLLLAILTYHFVRKHLGVVVGLLAAILAFKRGGEAIDIIREKIDGKV